MTLILFLLLSVLFLTHGIFLQAQYNGRITRTDPSFRIKTGKQYALFIAIDEYQHWPELKYPVKETKEIKQTLTSRYYIDKAIECPNKKATRKKIINQFKWLQNTLEEEDSLLIYYSGHGSLDSNNNNGYLIPVDGGLDEDEKVKWIPYSEIIGYIANMRTRHILLISDSCHSGGLLEQYRGVKKITSAFNRSYYEKIYSKRCRQALTSGTESEKVPDKSAFAQKLNHILQTNKALFLDGQTIYVNVSKAEGMKTLPLFGELKGTKHQKGAGFIFFLKPLSPQSDPAPETPPSTNLEELTRWANWQEKFEKDVKKAQDIEQKTSGQPNLKKEAWQRIWNEYQRNNPYSKKDEQLRELVKERIEYWNQEMGFPPKKYQQEKEVEKIRWEELQKWFEEFITYCKKVLPGIVPYPAPGPVPDLIPEPIRAEYEIIEEMWETTKQMKTEAEAKYYFLHDAPFRIRGATNAFNSLELMAKNVKKWSGPEIKSYRIRALAMIAEMLNMSSNPHRQNRIYRYILKKEMKDKAFPFSPNDSPRLDNIEDIIKNNKEYLDLIGHWMLKKITLNEYDLLIREKKLNFELLTLEQKVQAHYILGRIYEINGQRENAEFKCYHFTRAWQLMNKNNVSSMLLNKIKNKKIMIEVDVLKKKMCNYCSHVDVKDFNEKYQDAQTILDIFKNACSLEVSER